MMNICTDWCVRTHVLTVPPLVTPTSWPVNSENHANYFASQASAVSGRVSSSGPFIGELDSDFHSGFNIIITPKTTISQSWI